MKVFNHLSYFGTALVHIRITYKCFGFFSKNRHADNVFLNLRHADSVFNNCFPGELTALLFLRK